MSGATNIRSSRSLCQLRLLAALALPLGCAVAIDPELPADEVPGAGGSGGGKGPGGSMAGTTSSLGGTSASGGSGSSSGGKGGQTASTGGKSSGGSGSGGKAASGGAASGGTGGGSAGASSGGTGGKVSSGGSGGSSAGGGGPVSCGNAIAWVGGDSTLTIAQGDTVSWKGKRYVATTNIAYPNAECAPDAPATWCAEWFTADGDC